MPYSRDRVKLTSYESTGMILSIAPVVLCDDMVHIIQLRSSNNKILFTFT